MSDFKSKLPDFKELTSMTSKLFKGIKSSVEEIIKDYKDKRAEAEVKEEVAEKKPASKKAAEEPEKKPVEEPKSEEDKKS